jgi:hypothetical protein
MYLQHIPETDQFIFLDAGQPYRMIGSPMLFPSLRDAVEAAEFCGFSVLPDGRVFFRPKSDLIEPQSSLFIRSDE